MELGFDLGSSESKSSTRKRFSHATIFFFDDRISPNKSIRSKESSTSCTCWDIDHLLFQLDRSSRFRFLDKIFDFFKPSPAGGFNEILLVDPLSNVTCRTLLAFSDLLVYPHQSSSSHIKVIDRLRKSRAFSRFSSSSSFRFSRVTSLEHYWRVSAMPFNR